MHAGGKAVVKFLTEKGANVMAVSDSKGGIYQPDGLDYETLLKVKETTGTVKNYKGGRIIENEELFRLPVDIPIPGARPDVISKKMSETLEQRLSLKPLTSHLLWKRREPFMIEESL